ncbi:MAG: hypothetical protein H8E21_01075 [Gammaproteobacteria bacterium]|nr:hypothetical protein [Gammaproteobacteria bacterium]
MKREQYLAEVKHRLEHIFAASRDGYRVPSSQRHRLEGFMQAGVFLGLASTQELSRLMQELHFDVYGKTIEDRKHAQPVLWQDQSIDYNEYDQPTYERNQRK